MAWSEPSVPGASMEAVDETIVHDAAKRLTEKIRRFRRSAKAPLTDAAAPEALTDVSAVHD